MVNDATQQLIQQNNQAFAQMGDMDDDGEEGEAEVSAFKAPGSNIADDNIYYEDGDDLE